MRNAPFFRTFVACAYLLALVLHGRWDGRTAGLALAVLAVWAVPVIRDARRNRGAVRAASAR
ncbi:hypothetical protein [Actinoplanes auranticolor]|uniref:Uncharacterized protein n=1 Tax=Actinoplanes auranticolor TaxID=47988 RepID=A0A919STF2_9ACTN|nr:hypothetical protein [Actinoplanes auranticolor]GIM77226.1 hypothetical protein Aau02nite_74880 [Actinoplanes auranticolor]